MMVRRWLTLLLMGVMAVLCRWSLAPLQAERTEPEIWQATIMQRLQEPWRSHALSIARSPQVCWTGRAETFPCRRELYAWLLEHPDWGYRLWEQLGARGAQVRALGNGEFVGQDDQGNRLQWRTIHQEPGLRLWYVEATGRGKLLSQPAQVRALVLLRYRGVRSAEGQTGIRHQSELAAQVDARGWNLIVRLGQQAAHDFARQCLEQVQLFFAGMAWYMTEHPDWTREQIRKLMRERPDQHVAAAQLLQLLAASEETDEP
ncbi:MAG: hypothetical protein NZM42_05780 [Gemmatales bacterium]|nr:hypothetical protein [Gemmatales bacterium]